MYTYLIRLKFGIFILNIMSIVVNIRLFHRTYVYQDTYSTHRNNVRYKYRLSLCLDRVSSSKIIYNKVIELLNKYSFSTMHLKFSPTKFVFCVKVIHFYRNFDFELP